MSNSTQDAWFLVLDHFRAEVEKELGPETEERWLFLHKESEKRAQSYLANRLREAADQIESNTYSRVYGCCVPMPDQKLVEEGMGEISVILSYPWPG